MDRLFRKLAKIDHFIAMGLVGAWALLSLVISAMSIGGDAEDILNGLFTIVMILVLAGGFIVAVLMKKTLPAKAFAAILLIRGPLSILFSPILFPFAEGFIAYNIFRILAALALCFVFAMLVLSWFDVKLEKKIFQFGHLAIFGYCAAEIVAATVLLILAIVYGAQGAQVATIVLQAILFFISAPMFAILYFFFICHDKIAALPEDAPKAEEPKEEPKVEEPIEEPKAEEPVEEPKAEEPVEEAPVEKEPVAEDKAPADEPNPENPKGE